MLHASTRLTFHKLDTEAMNCFIDTTRILAMCFTF